MHQDELHVSALSAWKRIGRKAVITCVLGMIIFLLLHFSMEAALSRYPVLKLPSEIALHIGIGFIVALILIAVLELEVRQVAHQELTRDVFEAVLERIVPPEIMEEFNNILRFEVARKDCEYTITFKEPPTGMSPEVVIVRREVSFTVRNLLNRPVSYAIRAYHETDADFTSAGHYKHHLALRVDGKDVDLVEGTNVFIEPGHARLEQPIIINPDKHSRVYLQGEELVAISAQSSSYIQMTPALGIRVIINNDYPERIHNPRVTMNHPQWLQMTEDEPDRYRLEKAFLPGQGFQVVWTTETSGDLEHPTEGSQKGEGVLSPFPSVGKAKH